MKNRALTLRPEWKQVFIASPGHYNWWFMPNESTAAQHILKAVNKTYYATGVLDADDGTRIHLKGVIFSVPSIMFEDATKTSFKKKLKALLK